MAIDEAVEKLAAEQGPRWPSRKAAWLDGYREGEQHARMTGAHVAALRARLGEMKRFVPSIEEDDAGEVEAATIRPHPKGDLLRRKDVLAALDHLAPEGEQSNPRRPAQRPLRPGSPYRRERQVSGFPKNISRVGAYVVKAAETRPTRVSPRSLLPGESLPKPTEEDKAMAREMLRIKREENGK